jgi:hypothetical protein
MGANVNVRFPGNDPIDVAGGLGVGLSGGVNLGGGVGAALSGNLGVGAALSGGVDVGVTALPPIHVSIDALPKINIGLDPIRVILDPLRCHLPVDMSVGFNLFGHDVACIRVCGEAQFIAEPYVPNPCECAPHKEK